MLPMLERLPTVPASVMVKSVLVPSETLNEFPLPIVVVKSPATDAPVAVYVPPESVPPETVPPDSAPPEIVAPLIDEKFEMVLDPEPVMLPVEVNAPMLVAAIVLTVSVAVVPLSCTESNVCGDPALSLMVKVPFESADPMVKIGLVAESVSGEVLESVKAWLEVAPRAVTDWRVSASVPVMVIVPVPELTETVLMPPPAMVTSLTKVLSELT